jgi:general secretion pathway protein C
LITICFVIFNQKKPATRTSIRPEAFIAASKKDVSKINIATIYENDLFNTSVRKTFEEKQKSDGKIAIPQPPILQPLPVPQPARIDFLSPLPITLKGIIFTNNDAENHAIIANNKTKQEALYKIGDKIEDADIIHISRHKIILIRSNGQQETIFITPADAQEDPIYARDKSWTYVVKKISDTVYKIDPKAFMKRINNLAQFIDMLDVTTAFSKGKSLGCRIGMLTPQSIGPSLGLQQGDIIATINDIPVTTTQDRLTLYNTITTLPLQSTIRVKFIRNEQEYIMSYVLERISEAKNEQENLAIGTPITIQETANIQNIPQATKLIEASQQNPLVNAIKQQDKGTMLRHGGRASVIQRIPQ